MREFRTSGSEGGRWSDLPVYPTVPARACDGSGWRLTADSSGDSGSSVLRSVSGRQAAHEARHQLAMAVVDEWVVPALQGRRELDGPRLLDVLGALEAAVATTKPMPCLWVLHVAPIWVHLTEFRPELPVTQAIVARPMLRSWLDAAARLPCVQGAWLDEAELGEVLKHARAAGLLPPQTTRSAS